jgi:hypothetical protein
LPITLYAALTYRHVIPQAQRVIAHRDPDVVDVRALALQLDIPIWTNDNDFHDVSLPLYTTAQLMHLLLPTAPLTGCWKSPAAARSKPVKRIS